MVAENRRERGDIRGAAHVDPVVLNAAERRALDAFLAAVGGVDHARAALEMLALLNAQASAR